MPCPLFESAPGRLVRGVLMCGAVAAGLAGCAGGSSAPAAPPGRVAAGRSPSISTPTTTGGAGLAHDAVAGVVEGCRADVISVQTAVEEYFVQHGAWPAAGDWPALVPAYLRSRPTTTHYAVNIGPGGKVSADRAGATAYSATDDVDANPSACANNASPNAR